MIFDNGLMFSEKEALDILVPLLKAESEPAMSKDAVLDVVLPVLSELGFA